MKKERLQEIVMPSGIIDVFIDMECKTLEPPDLEKEEFYEKIKESRQLFIECMSDTSFLLTISKTKESHDHVLDLHKSLFKNLASYYEIMASLIDGYVEYEHYQTAKDYLVSLKEPKGFFPFGISDDDVALIDSMYDHTPSIVHGFIQDGEYTIQLHHEESLSFSIIDKNGKLIKNGLSEQVMNSYLYFASRLCVMLLAADSFSEAFFNESYPGDDEETILKRGLLLKSSEYNALYYFLNSSGFIE